MRYRSWSGFHKSPDTSQLMLRKVSHDNEWCYNLCKPHQSASLNTVTKARTVVASSGIRTDWSLKTHPKRHVQKAHTLLTCFRWHRRPERSEVWGRNVLRDNFQLWYTGPFSQHIRLILIWPPPRTAGTYSPTTVVRQKLGNSIYILFHRNLRIFSPTSYACRNRIRSETHDTWFLEHKLTCQTKKSCEGTVTLGLLSFYPQMSDFRVIHQGGSPVLRKARGSAVTSCDDAKLGWASHIYALWNILAAFLRGRTFDRIYHQSQYLYLTQYGPQKSKEEAHNLRGSWYVFGCCCFPSGTWTWVGTRWSEPRRSSRRMWGRGSWVKVAPKGSYIPSMKEHRDPYQIWPNLRYPQYKEAHTKRHHSPNSRNQTIRSDEQ